MRGRWRSELNLIADAPRELARLASLGATLSDLGAIFSVPGEALAAQHGPLLEKSWALHRMRIRRGFLLAADRGDVAALAFLARAHLVEHTATSLSARVQLPAMDERREEG